MKTTSLELSKKIFATFGWESWFVYTKSGDILFAHTTHEEVIVCPVYDTEFLLDKLRSDGIIKGVGVEIYIDGTNLDSSIRNEIRVRCSDDLIFTADTLAEALGNLCLALKELGLLGGKDE